MYPSPSETQEVLAATLEALDAAAGEPPDNAEQRREPRRPLRAKCELCFFHGPEAEAATLDGVARNITFTGLSVIITTLQAVRRGRPLEAIMTMPDLSKTHVAGVVVFCRRVDDDCFERMFTLNRNRTSP